MNWEVTLRTMQDESFDFPKVEIVDLFDDSLYLYVNGEPHFFKWEDIKSTKIIKVNK